MIAYELSARVNEHGRLEIPTEQMPPLEPDQVARVIVLLGGVEDTGDDSAWRRLTDGEFMRGYAEADFVYDRL